jgi:hypothetical protein
MVASHETPSPPRTPGQRGSKAPGSASCLKKPILVSRWERMFGVFPPACFWRRHPLATCSDGVSLGWRGHHVAAPHPPCGLTALVMAMAERWGLMVYALDTFQPFELSAPLPKKLAWMTAHYSPPFYAILLRSVKAIPAENPTDEC